MLILTKNDIEKSVTMEEIINAMSDAFTRYTIGTTDIPIRTKIDIIENEGNTLIMPGYINKVAMATKLISIFPKNHFNNKPTINSIIVLEDIGTGEFISIMEGSYITALRTGATGGLAAKYLSKLDSEIVTVIGAGVQAITQLWAILCVRKIKIVKVYDIDFNRSEKYINNMSKKFPNVNFYNFKSADKAILDSDIIITTTTSKKPVFDSKLVKNGVHINAIGSYTPDMQEIPSDLLKKANKIVVDSKDSVLSESGDFIIPIKTGFISPDSIYCELGDITSNNARGRENENEITLFKTVGLALQDIACANLIYKSANEMNIGKKINLND